MRPKVLLISNVPLGTTMSGTAIRSYELARALGRHADVKVAGVHSETEPPAGIDYSRYWHQDPRALRPLVEWADAIFAQPQWPLITRFLERSGARLVFDLYNPAPLEKLALGPGEALRRRRLDLVFSIDRIVNALRIGHHFVCATYEQRDLWLGTMLGHGLLDATAYDRDPSFRSIIDTLPFGLPEDPPSSRGDRPIRARFPGIGEDDEIVLWNGGIWRWLDAPTAIRAMRSLLERRPGARLVFMVGSTSEAAQRSSADALEVARDTGLLDRTVFFNEGWVPYEERDDWMLEADCALSAHHDHLESRFAFRTRFLDCFWARLPIVCTRGDALADRVEREELGATFAEGDVEGAAGALERVLSRGRADYADRLAAVAEEYTWPRIAEPLVRYVTRQDPTPRLGESAAGPVRRPAHYARDLLYSSARQGLNSVGLNHWPNWGAAP